MMNNLEVSDSMYDEQFDVTWDENDMIQVNEDDWISSVIGTEEDAIYDVLAEIKWTKIAGVYHGSDKRKSTVSHQHNQLLYMESKMLNM